MRYEAIQPATGSRFELERDEPLNEGDILKQLSMVYKVRRVLPGNEEFDAVIEVEWQAGPAQAEYVPS